MKIGVMSDTHGKHYSTKKAFMKMGNIDALIHLGDHCTDLSILQSECVVPTYTVRGNCDFSRQYPDFLDLVLEGKRFFITHGHLYHIKMGFDRIAYKAQEVSADVVLYGHTHMPEIFFEKGILFLNPGSTGSPRGGRHATVGVIDIVQGKLIPHIINIDER